MWKQANSTFISYYTPLFASTMDCMSCQQTQTHRRGKYDRCERSLIPVWNQWYPLDHLNWIGRLDICNPIDGKDDNRDNWYILDTLSMESQIYIRGLLGYVFLFLRILLSVLHWAYFAPDIMVRNFWWHYPSFNILKVCWQFTKGIINKRAAVFSCSRGKCYSRK